MNAPTVFRIDFRPDVTLIPNVHRFVCEFFSSVLEGEDDAARIGLTVFELLENVVKYSLDGRGKLSVGVDGNIAEVRVKNRTTPECAAEIERRVLELSNSSDPLGDYLRMMSRSVKEDSGAGGLGLARIRAEADMILTYESEGDEITLSATGELTPRGLT